MDATDAKLLRAMMAREDGSPDAIRPARLARVLGTTRDTVRARLGRLEERGVIAGYAATVNARLVGLRTSEHFVRFADVASRERAKPRLEASARILAYHDYLGGPVCATLAYEDKAERDAALALLRDASGSAPRHFLSSEEPRVARTLTRTEWRILARLREDPMRATADLAADLGVAARTVKRHVARLAGEGHVYVLPRLDPARASGALLVDLLFYLRRGEDKAARRAILREFEAERIWDYEPQSSELGHFNLMVFVRSLADVDALPARAATLPGVERAEAWLFTRFAERPSVLDALLRERAGLA